MIHAVISCSSVTVTIHHDAAISGSCRSSGTGLYVLGVRHSQLLTLVTGQLDGLAEFRGDGTLVATLTQEGVDGLNAVPA